MPFSRLLAFGAAFALFLRAPLAGAAVPATDANGMLLADNASALQQTRPLRSESFAEATGPATNAYGVLLADNASAIDQSRLLRDNAVSTDSPEATTSSPSTGEEGASDDDSFGSQQILKTQERPKPFSLSGGASLIYTNNAALTRFHTREDFFGIFNAGVSWTKPIATNLEGNLGGQAAIFRYNDLPALDFDSFGFGAGLSWTPSSLPGVNFFARYDFTELLTRDGDEILSDHAFSAGAQKTVALGRSHAITFGLSGLFDLADPSSARRSQLGAFVAYHLQLTRKFSSDLLVRPAVHFYTGDGRTDLNHIFSANFHYHLSEFADLGAFVSDGLNRSSRPANNYNALTSGGGIDFAYRF